MRVLLVSEPGRDGVFRHVEGLVQHLLQEGVEVDLAYSSRRSCADLAPLVEQVRTHGGTAVDLGVGPGPGPGDLVALGRILGLALRRRPDIVHAHSSKAGGLVRLLAPMLPDAKLVYTPHAYIGMDGDTNLKTRFFHALETWLGPVCPSIHVSVDERDFGVRNFQLEPSDCTVLEHGVDTERFSPASEEERSQARERFGLGDDQVVIGTIGRMGPQKDYPSLYRALAPLFDENPDRVLLQVGTGPDATAIRDLAEQLGIGNRIVAIDELDDPAEFYRALDLIVLASTYEAGVPYVALEALATGLPMVATRCPGLRTLGHYGFDSISFAEPSTPTDLHRALHERLSHPTPSPATTLPHLQTNHRSTTLPHLQTNHRSTTTAHFTVKQSRQRVLEFYSSTLGRHVGATATPLS